MWQVHDLMIIKKKRGDQYIQCKLKELDLFNEKERASLIYKSTCPGKDQKDLG
jgi:hypothetical protein